MPDIDYFYELVLQVKKANRKYLSNYYLNESIWAEAVRQGDVTYQYKEKEYLSLWWRKEHFRRLYYFIGVACQYKVADNSATCVCDVICKKADLETVCRTLSDAGMNRYAVYEKWACRAPVLSGLHCQDDFQIIDEDNGDIFIDKLYLYFDELSDLLPDKKEVGKFIEEKHFIGVHNTGDDALVAGIVYTKQGSVITEEFLFVTAGYRGMGISRLLYRTLYQKYVGEAVKYIAWIRMDNLESRNFHCVHNYEKQNQYKVTFLKKGI